MATTPDGKAPTEAQSRALPYPFRPVTPVTYELIGHYKGFKVTNEWVPGGRLAHPEGTLASSVEEKPVPTVGSEFVLFLRPAHDWREGHGTLLLAYPRVQVCRVENGTAVCSGYSMPLDQLLQQLTSLSTAATE